MVESSQVRSERATPAQWIERLDFFRERFRLRLIDESKFNDILRSFQFSDDLGHIWMPGATSDQWYRWDRTKWTVAAPPQQLAASNIPITMALTWNREQIPTPPNFDVNRIQASTPSIAIEPPRAETIAKSIESPQIETKPAPIVPVPVSPTPPATAPLPARATCPHCGQSYFAPATFCPNCGKPLTAENSAAASAVKKPARPTDLPERGITRSRSKPTDLPH